MEMIKLLLSFFCFIAVGLLNDLIAKSALSHVKIDSYINSYSYNTNEVDIGCRIILHSSEEIHHVQSMRSSYTRSFVFSAYDKYVYVKDYVLKNSIVRRGIIKRLNDIENSEIPENACMAFIGLGLIEKFNARYTKSQRLYLQTDVRDVSIQRLNLSVVLTRKGEIEDGVNFLTKKDAGFDIKAYACVVTKDNAEIIASSFNSTEVCLSCVFMNDRTCVVGLMFSDDVSKRISKEVVIYVFIPNHGITALNVAHK